jgi:hypothetical protein
MSILDIHLYKQAFLDTIKQAALLDQFAKDKDPDIIRYRKNAEDDIMRARENFKIVGAILGKPPTDVDELEKRARKWCILCSKEDCGGDC